MKYFGMFKFSSLVAAVMLLVSPVQQKVYAAKCPCDIYADGGTPCAAAHSMVRALYSSYSGPLYQVRRISDQKTKDIYPLTPGGAANTAPQDSFLTGTSGRISILYDQSANHNDLKSHYTGYWGPADTEAVATDASIKLNGHKVYGLLTYGGFSPNSGVGYRNNATKGMPTGNASEGMYMVCDAKRYNQWCCFDYGNAETNAIDDGPATMECIYYGSSTQFEKCGGSGPWICNDMENGMTCGAELSDTSNHSIDVKNINYLTTIVKGGAHPGQKDTNFHAIKAGDAQKGRLELHYAGHRPTKAGGSGADYYPLKLQGAIILGTGGDNSHSGIGTFFEGAMVTGCPTDATEDSLQANIVAAGFGSTVTSTRSNPIDAVRPTMFKVNYNPSTGSAVIRYAMQDARPVSMNIIDQRGRLIAVIVNGVMPAGRHAAVWNAKSVPAGVYVCRVAIDGRKGWAGKIVIGK
jgi:hypothetical protein